MNPFLKKSLATLGLMALAVAANLTPLPAAENPFEQIAEQSYAGRFTGPEVSLRLKPEGGNWSGTILFKGKSFTITGKNEAGQLAGTFGEGDQSWPFTAKSDGEQLTFTAGTFTATLVRQKLPKLQGVYASKRVKLAFKNEAGGINGVLTFNGKQFPFSAAEANGDLAGVFKSGDEAFQFTLVNDPSGLTFQTGSFAEVITQLPNQGILRIQTIPVTAYTLINSGKSVAGQDGVYDFPGGQLLTLGLKAKGYQAAQTNLIIPDYGETRWVVTLEETPFPKLDKPFTNSLGMLFAPVTKTSVLFGVWDVRVMDFEAFVGATGYDASRGMQYYSITAWGSDKWRKNGYNWRDPSFSQGPTHPVVGVNWHDAKAFCDWLTKKERAEGKIAEYQNYRLPTDAEWSMAVGLENESGSTPGDKDGKIKNVYPWGATWPPPNGAGNYGGKEARNMRWPELWATIKGYNDGYARTSPVGSFATNQFGLYDMGGNVWQWCEDWYNGEQKSRVLRGASWGHSDDYFLLSSFRLRSSPDDCYNNFGFRCVLGE